MCVWKQATLSYLTTNTTRSQNGNSTPSLSSLFYISILFPFICIPINDLLTAENVKLLIHPFIRPIDCTARLTDWPLGREGKARHSLSLSLSIGPCFGGE